MRKRFKDWISLLEAGYDLEGSDERWLAHILSRAIPLLNRGMWPSIATFKFDSTQVDIEHIETEGPQIFEQWVHASTREIPQVLDLMYRSSTAVASLSEFVYSRVPDLHNRVCDLTHGVMNDLLGIKAHTGAGRGVFLFTGFSRPTFATSDELRRWPLIVSHLGAGLRLRQVTRNLALESDTVEAILDPSGNVQHIQCAVNNYNNRTWLRNSACTIERLRSSNRARSDPDFALPLWQGLVNGRWSLVDRFDTDGKRFLVAIRNDPAHADPRGLTDRERQVAEYLGLGYANKAIAYTLGIASTTVANCITRILFKLGLHSRLELVAFFAPSGLRARLVEVTMADENLIIGSYPLAGTATLEKLTDAEREVLVYLVAGSTNQDIAERRNTSVRTVANQVQSIFGKFHVRSRTELATQLHMAV